jgi:pimeloyl-ACP methyl ester carboxylesterase
VAFKVWPPKTGRLWTYVRDGRPCADAAPPAAWFAFSPDRRGEHPQGHLKSFRGTLQADAYAGFHELYEGCRILEAACWAHARRKLHDIPAAAQSPTASEAIRRIGELYAIEKEVRGSPSEIRLAIRQARARPVMEALRAWFDATLQTFSAKSDMAGAIRYAISRWTALTRYLDDGEVEIDNNAAERALRVVALGRKNYLFAGSNRGGERAAAFYSLIGSAKLNGLNPELYLRHVLTRIGDHPINRIAELLPWNIAEIHAYAFLNAPGQAEIQSDLFFDYRTNVEAYTTWQAWMRRTQPRLLVIWGRHDLSFDLGEPERYRAGVPNAKVAVLDAGHFALDTKADEIAELVRGFIKR